MAPKKTVKSKKSEAVPTLFGHYACVFSDGRRTALIHGPQYSCKLCGYTEKHPHYGTPEVIDPDGFCRRCKATSVGHVMFARPTFAYWEQFYPVTGKPVLGYEMNGDVENPDERHARGRDVVAPYVSERVGDRTVFFADASVLNAFDVIDDSLTHVREFVEGGPYRSTMDGIVHVDAVGDRCAFG